MGPLTRNKLDLYVVGRKKYNSENEEDADRSCDLANPFASEPRVRDDRL